MTRSAIPDLLRERASLQPNDPAFTFMDYQQDWAGVEETLTWSQTYRRVRNLAHDLRLNASPGDRVVILAEQSLEYVTAFLGALEAGLTAVPLSLPDAGAHDARVEAVLRDASPAVILSTSSVVDTVTKYAEPKGGKAAPLLLEVDRLDLDARRSTVTRVGERPELAYLQYTSGSTRQPAGVMISHRNLSANFEQVMADYFDSYGGLAPPQTSCVSWLPLYHDMGLFLGVAGPILGGYRSVLTSPMSFLQRPARWLQLLASHPLSYTAAPNFAFELTAKRASDEDMAGHDLGGVLCILSGAERIHEATVKRFMQRFAQYNLDESVIRPSYGLAEATVYVASRRCPPGGKPEIVHFESEKLSAGHAKRCVSGTGSTGLVSYGVPQSPTVKIVDPDTQTECPAGKAGEIWVQGDNVAMGYWHKQEETQHTFGGLLAAAPTEASGEAWLRTGDLGFFSDGELFIMGRIKDLLIVYGRNHYPDDIEATVQEISGGRVAAVSVPDGPKEKLVVVIEVKKRGDSHEEVMDKLLRVKRDVASALSSSHGLGFADLVLVSPGSIPITTSGKIRRSSCVEYYQCNKFTRLDASV